MEVYYQPDLAKGLNHLSQEESRHCVKVLRRKSGDKITVVDGKGLKVHGEITEANPKKCQFKVISQDEAIRNDTDIHIAIAPTKSIDRIEWFVEKSIEIGIQCIDFYFSSNSERRKLNLERIVKKAVSAMKQSGQSFLPEIKLHKDFKSLLKANIDLEQQFIAYVDFENPDHLMDMASKDSSMIVLIGPEGDFTEDELKLALDSGYRKVSLGNNRLRTETAALAACHILNLINR